MRTYAKANLKDEFDWNAFLHQELFTEEELYNAFELADKWITCACGNQCEIIPRNEYGMPIDVDLMILGRKFNDAIRSMWDACMDRQSLEDRIVYAKMILLQIEVRSQELINQLIQTKK